MAAWRYEISLLVLKNIYQHSKRNFVSPCGHVISSIYYMDIDEILGFFSKKIIYSPHAVKILFSSFTCKDIGVVMVTNTISQ